MKNCLVTTLKGSVDNPNLPILEVVKIQFWASDTQMNYIEIGNRYGNIKAHVDSTDGYFLVGNDATHYQDVDVHNGSQVKFVKNATGEAAELEIDLRATESLYGVLDLDNLTGSYNIVLMKPGQGAIDGDEAVGVIRSHGSIDSFAGYFPNLAHFDCTYSSTVTGSLNSFAECLNIQIINIRSTSGITGSLEGFAAAQIAAGRQSGSVIIVCNSKITYNGSAVGNGTQKTITYSGGSYTIS